MFATESKESETFVLWNNSSVSEKSVRCEFGSRWDHFFKWVRAFPKNKETLECSLGKHDGGWREQSGRQTTSFKPRLYQHCNERCSWHSHFYLPSNQYQCPQHPPARADLHSFQLWPQPSTIIPLPHSSPALGNPLTPALLRARWSIPDILPSPIEIKVLLWEFP